MQKQIESENVNRKAFLIVLFIMSSIVMAYYAVAKTNPLAVCWMVSDSGRSSGFYLGGARKCYFDAAMKAQDYSICERYSYAYKCLDDVRLELGRPERCEDFKDAMDDYYDIPYRDVCHYNWAQDLKDWSLCESIESEEHTISRDNCVVEVAFKTEDAKLCEMAGSHKGMCEIRFKAVGPYE